MKPKLPKDLASWLTSDSVVDIQYDTAFSGSLRLPEWCGDSPEFLFTSLLCEGLGAHIDLRGVHPCPPHSSDDEWQQRALEVLMIQRLVVTSCLAAINDSWDSLRRKTDIHVFVDGVHVSIELSSLPFDDVSRPLNGDPSVLIEEECAQEFSGFIEFREWEIDTFYDRRGCIDPILIGLCEHIMRAIPISISVRPIVADPLSDPNPVLAKAIGHALRQFLVVRI